MISAYLQLWQVGALALDVEGELLPSLDNRHHLMAIAGDGFNIQAVSMPSRQIPYLFELFLVACHKINAIWNWHRFARDRL